MMIAIMVWDCHYIMYHYTGLKRQGFWNRIKIKRLFGNNNGNKLEKNDTIIYL